MKPIDKEKYSSFQDRESQFAFEMEEIKRTRTELTKDIKDAQILRKVRISFISKLFEHEDKSYIHTILSGNREFALPPFSLVLFCYYLYGQTSCHEVLSGNKGITMLPKMLSSATEMFLALPESQQIQMIEFMNSFLDEDILSLLSIKNLENITDISDPSQWKRKRLYKINHRQLVKQRLLEAARDRAIRPIYLFGIPSRNGDRKAIEGYFSKVVKDTYSARYTTLLHFALQLDTSIDQFYVIDYTERTEVKLFGTRHIVTEKCAIEFIRRYLFIQYELPEVEQEILAKIMTLYFKTKDG